MKHEVVHKLVLRQMFVFRKSYLSKTEENGCLWTRVLSFGDLNSPGKMMTCYLRDINKFLRYCTLRKSILKCGFPTKGIKLTQFVLFEVLGVPQL